MSVQNDVLWRESAAALAARLACGELSARAVVEAHLDRIAATDSALSAFITVAADKALARAGDLDATLARTGRPVGPLHGVPVALKDLTDTAGIRTTYGSGFTPTMCRRRATSLRSGRRPDWFRRRNGRWAGTRWRRMG